MHAAYKKYIYTSRIINNQYPYSNIIIYYFNFRVQKAASAL